ncbi:hypothetical protein GE061_001931 [Apolygus lucorum]|uniref:MYND-type domain-containing protein n=1 Tax=Apolygus lucorum TaxID=248454 RepID=A0A6A4JDL0_APOLU|nr:hypothetical protein GE061_001931 [Apolygus lucorum]
MSSGDKVDSPDPSKTVSPSSSDSCSHCGSLFVHHKGCRYCLPSKNRTKVPLKKRLNAESGVKRESVKCLVPCCPNFANKNPKKAFFYPGVPDDRQHLWLRAIGVSTLPSKISICEEHFDLEADCENYVKFKYYPTKWNRLKKTVVPTRFPCKTKKSVSGSYPDHDHVFDDLHIPTKVTKKRSFPDDQSHQTGSVAKKQKVMVKVEDNEPEKAKSPKDKFDFLNGDITNLIAHVQPSICSWDVSVVDVHSPGTSAGKDSGSSSSKTSPEGSSSSKTSPEERNVTEGASGEGDVSESDCDDVLGMDQESSNDEDLDTESTGIERNSSKTKSKQVTAPAEPSVQKVQRATRSSKRISSSNQINSESCGSDRNVAEKQVKSICGGKTVDGVEEDSLHLTINSSETTSSTSGLSTEDGKTQSGSSTSVSAELIVVTTDEGPATPVADENRSTVELELTCEVEEPSGPNHKMAATSVSNEAKPKSSNNGDSHPKELEHPAAASASPVLEMEVDHSEGNVDATDAKPADNSMNTSSNRPLTSGRVADPNCSCVLCGGTSDVDEDGSEDDEDTQTPLRTESPVASGSKRLGASKIDTNRKNVLSARTPSIPMTRVVKHIDETSDLSEYVSESDSPETIASDSDSEWTPSDQERKLIPTRTTRSSTKAKETEKTPYKSQRIMEKSEKSRASSSIENGVKDSELKDSESKEGDEDVSENLSSLHVNMEETVASYKLNKTKTTYSYKQLYEGGSSTEGNAETRRSDKVLVVRENEYDAEEFKPKGPLPQPLIDLIENMKTYFDHFFEKLDKLKKTSKADSVHRSDDVVDESEENSTEKCIETLEEDVKMFPALLNLEMVQFVQKCKQHFQDKLDGLGERYKRVRWCVACPEAALFHCCFKAAYCSCKCQRKHWEEHRKDCAQETVTLLDPHLRLNSALMLRVKNLNKSKFTISDLEKSQPKPSNGEPKEDRTTDSSTERKLVPIACKSLCTPKSSLTKTTPVNSHFTPKMNGSATFGSNQFTKGETKTYERRIDRSMAARRASLKTSDKSLSVMNDPLKIVSPPNRTVPKTSATKKNETFLTSSAVKKSPVTLSSRTTSVAASAASSGSILLPKTMNNGCITTTAGSNQVVVKFRSVTLPNGDKRLIPIDLPADQGFSVVQNTSPTSGKQSSGSILITRPAAKSSYTATTGFIPLTQVSPSLSHPVILQQGVNGILTPVSSPVVSQSAPPLPTLTPIPKQGSCSIRTLNDDELNKILNTDHLQSAFDDSYYANTRIRS